MATVGKPVSSKTDGRSAASRRPPSRSNTSTELGRGNDTHVPHILEEQDIFESAHLGLLKICDVILVFLVCIVKQETSPLPAQIGLPRSRSKKTDISNLAGNWTAERRLLDDICRNLTSWRTSLGDEQSHLIPEIKKSLISALEDVSTSLTAVAHRLTHLVDSNRKNLDSIDPVLRTIVEKLNKEVNRLEKEDDLATDGCPACSNHVEDYESRSTVAYIEQLKFLVGELIEDSRPLTLALRGTDFQARSINTQPSGLMISLEGPGEFSHQSSDKTDQGEHEDDKGKRGSSASESENPLRKRLRSSRKQSPSKKTSEPRHPAATTEEQNFESDTD